HLSSQGDDRVYLCAVCPQLGEGVLSVAAYRRSRAVTLTLPARWQGRDVVLYGFVEDYAGRTSDSVCLGTLAAVDATADAARQQGVEAASQEASAREGTFLFMNEYNKIGTLPLSSIANDNKTTTNGRENTDDEKDAPPRGDAGNERLGHGPGAAVAARGDLARGRRRAG
ncbi:MAG: hypothetical protein IJ745_01640, partial [Bacteroidales bacterium]|nr:hypothetical protein [Bacteroidales bacterium]